MALSRAAGSSDGCETVSPAIVAARRARSCSQCSLSACSSRSPPRTKPNVVAGAASAAHGLGSGVV
eukprot:scaffold6820_cov282-Prasinococcus_capsulatus_cf.AAC.2